MRYHGGMKKLMIIGGGAAGLAAAVAAADALRARGVRVGADAGADGVDVAVCEADERVGRSILATGNGRCNFSNAQVDAAAYRNAAFVGAALDELRRAGGLRGGDGADPVHAFFADLGLVWREEGEGRLYPLANKATSVLEVLRAAASDAGVREECRREAVRLDAPARKGDRFHVRFADGAVLHAEAVIVAAGGNAARALVPEGLAWEEPRAVLGPLRTDARLVKALNNIRVRCAASLVGRDGAEKACERGEVLFRDYGVSGIAVFNLSRFAEPGDTLRIDLLPQHGEAPLEELLRARLASLRERGGAGTGDDALRGMTLPAVGRAVIASGRAARREAARAARRAGARPRAQGTRARGARRRRGAAVPGAPRRVPRGGVRSAHVRGASGAGFARGGRGARRGRALRRLQPALGVGERHVGGSRRRGEPDGRSAPCLRCRT